MVWQSGAIGKVEVQLSPPMISRGSGLFTPKIGVNTLTDDRPSSVITVEGKYMIVTFNRVSRYANRKGVTNLARGKAW